MAIQIMTWGDYMSGHKDLSKYMTTKYGDSGVYMLETSDNRIPERLNHKYNIVTTIEKMVFGQFIMAERALTSGHEYNIALDLLAKAIIRPGTDTVFDNTDDTKELELNNAIPLESAKDIMALCVAYTEIRDLFVNTTFAGVFYKSKEETDVEEEDEDTEEEGTFEQKFNKDWYWHTIVDSLANNDILKHEPILMLEMQDVAPHLAYLRMKGIIDYKQRKAEEMAARIKTR